MTSEPRCTDISDSDSAIKSTTDSGLDCSATEITPLEYYHVNGRVSSFFLVLLILVLQEKNTNLQ